MKKVFWEYLKITAGTLILALGISLFLVPANLATGGVTGFAIVMTSFFPQMDVGAIMMISNVVLFAVGFAVIGPSFGVKTIYSSFALSGIVWAIEVLMPLNGPIVDDLMINLIFGVVTSGIGLAIVFYEDASTGGTDIIAKIINKFFDLDMGKALLAADFLIVLVAVFAFDIKTGLYALLGVFMNSIVVDGAIEGLSRKIQVSIISKQPDIIKMHIIEHLDRGATLYNAEGVYSSEEKKVITTVVNRREFIRLRKFIKAEDPNAFVMCTNVIDVLGEFER